jgi:indoleamine 2,3-dioxygenase
MRDMTRGFLPPNDPPAHLPEAFAAWDEFGRMLPKLLLSRHLRTQLLDLPPFPLDALTDEATTWRCASLLAYITSLYVLGADDEPVAQIPAIVAQPFVAIAQHLGIPPILSYALQAMHNWRRIDHTEPIALGNLALLNNFLGGMDEEWFVTLHINMEAIAGAALSRLHPAQLAVAQHNVAQLEADLITVADTLQAMHDLFLRMPERCDPYIYYHRVRPFMFGWKDNAALPNGVVYEGQFGNQPQQLRGETGAQSGIIPAIDAALGITHEQDAMRIYLTEMRDYMPPSHRAFVAALEQGPSIRAFVQAEQAARPSLRDAYNHAIEKLEQFRALHIGFAARYILAPARSESAVGTGGTPFTFYLKKHIKETTAHLL